MISAGHVHVIACTDSNEVLSWGCNSRGQLGDGSRIDRFEPAKAFSAPLVAVSAGGLHSLGLTSRGEVIAWGDNEFGQLGDSTCQGRLTPVTVTNGGVKAVSAGWHHSLALTEAGEVLAWGCNNLGQLGNGNTETIRKPCRVLGGVQAISAGGRHSLALTTGGAVLSWGANDVGQLGLGCISQKGTCHALPVEVISSGVKLIAAGQSHCLALTLSGEVLAWGGNEDGQLGDGSTETRPSPVKVREASAILLLAAGQSHSMALTVDGRVLTWGSNRRGQLGDGTAVPKFSPVQVFQRPDIISIVAGWHFNFIQSRERSDCWAWGANEHGQQGNGKTAIIQAPTLALRGRNPKVHPVYFSVSLQQLNELDTKARTTLGARYQLSTTRNVVDQVVSPCTAHLPNFCFARLVNGASLLAANVFVSHAWDESFADFVATVNGVFASVPGVRLWICFLALCQHGLRVAKRPGLQPQTSAFAEVIERVEMFLLVRNKRVDVYSRLWCVWEIFLADRLGFRDKPNGILVAGSNAGFQSSEPVHISECEASEPEDRAWLIEGLGLQALEACRVATEVRGLYYC